MNKHDLVQLLASRAEATPAAIADRLDAAIDHILRQLRKGSPVALPGLGTLMPRADARVELHPFKTRRTKKD